MIVASCATIPPRILDGSVFEFIDSMLNQTLEVSCIYVNMPMEYQRFKGGLALEQLVRQVQDYHYKVKVNRTTYDSPLIKHLGMYQEESDDTFIFVGDDDQVYHPELLQRMMEGYFDHEAVMQNRMHAVCTGSGGIVHGFVGLMYKAKHLEGFSNFPLPKQCWVDDQLMSIYFHKMGVRIIPSPVHHYSDIYDQSGLEDLHECTGGAEALHKMGDRDSDVRELADLYSVEFLHTHDPNGQGKIIDI